jgi:hypothetical protein
MRVTSRQAPIHVEDRVTAPLEPGRDRLRDGFFTAIGRITLGLVRGERWRVKLGPLTMHEFDAPVPTEDGWSWRIRGGLLTSRPGGTLRFEWRSGQVASIVDGYWPSLPRSLYRLSQLRAHHLVTRLFLLELRGRIPPPGVPAGPAQRLAAATLDLVFCALATGAVARRRRLAAFPAVAVAYHLAGWCLFGRTLGGGLLGQRVVSLDGGRVGLVQAAYRLGTLPMALARFRAVHDETALTEVVEANRREELPAGAAR